MLTRRTSLAGIAATSAILGTGRVAFAAPGFATKKDGIAIDGYDTSAYWNDNKAAMGQPAFTTDWNSVHWLFTSQANLDAFKASPDKFAPAFKGYCPFCLAGGRLVPGVANLYTIYHDKLYLLLSKRIKDDFDLKIDTYIERATAYWSKLS